MTPKSRAADVAYERIRKDLVAGRWPSGTHLREAEVAAELGMSRTPVREAIRRLSAEAVLHFEPHLGAKVPGWTPRDLEEIFSLRLNLEGLAAELAAQNATIAQIAKLDRLAHDMAEIATQGEAQLGKLAEFNAAFHRAIIESSGNSRLERLVELVTELPLVVRTFAHYDARAMRRSVSHHFELVDAIRAKDGDWARAVMEAHLRAGREVMLKGLMQD
ncbi:MAG: GntR family transcriptional regulator [Bosea sp.]|nr:GntR family transcriptional regulator [Bosea sp. (in: a-proteobacteria)]MCO5090889.1 GntR family transcriptional regulator [Bosea sp. (in: a-proteobacteria)]